MADKPDKDILISLMNKLRVSATEEEAQLLKQIGQFPLRLVTPYPKQSMFLKDGTQIRILIGGNSSGKTFIGSVEFVSRMDKTHLYDKVWNARKEPIYGMVLVEDKEQATQHGASQSKIISMLPADKIKKMQFDRGFLEEVIFNDGSTITVRSSKAGRKSLQGSRLDIIWIDEDCLKYSSLFDELLFRLSDSGQMPLILITYTPNLEDSKESFTDSVLLPRFEEPDGKYDMKLHQFSLFDNPHIPDSTKQMLLRNASGDADQLNARFDGDSKKKHGLIYHKFNKSIHVIPPISNEYIKANCKAIFRIIDPHQVKPTAVSFIGCFNDGKIIQFNELFSPGLIMDVAKRIRRVCDGLGHLVRKTIIDYAGNTSNPIKGISIRDELQTHGIWCDNCVKDVTLGIYFVREMLDYRNGSDGMEPRSPIFYVTSNCVNTIREFSKYREDPKTNMPYKKKDEFMDNLRYFACDSDAKPYYLKGRKNNVVFKTRVIDETATNDSGGNTERLNRIKARQNRTQTLIGRGVGRRN